MSNRRAQRSATRRFRLPPSHWGKVWAAWCPTCEQEAMPLPSGICGICDTSLAGQPTRGPYEKPLTGLAPVETASKSTPIIELAA